MRQAICLLGLLVAVTGCEVSTSPAPRDGGGDTDGSVQGVCTPGSPGFYCDGAYAVDCLADGSERMRTDCAASGQTCVSGVGCAVCRANTFRCQGDNVEQCRFDGSGWEHIATCDSAAGQMCNANLGICRSPCEDAAASNSYIGCEYWPTTTANTVDARFDFAVVVANPQTTPANITVTRNGNTVATATVPAGGLETIRLPWVMELKEPFTRSGAPASSLVRGGAYRLQSSLPVTVYQFNPLEYQSGSTYSHTNDASLLLPTHVLTGNYIAVSERTLATQCPGGSPDSIPGFVTIVGTSATPVEVNVSLRGHVASSADGAVAEAGPGSTQTYTLNQGDVLQLASKGVTSCTSGGTTDGQCGLFSPLTHCRVPDDYDLTGTEIRASGPVMVIGGHACAFMPFNRFACDHMEETIFPLESWGSDFVVSMAKPLRSEPNIVRIISGRDGNTVMFDPPSVHSSVSLSRGQVLEFEAREDFHIKGTGPLLVAQFLVGQNYDGSISDTGAGDPAMSLAIPTEQFRSDYTFLAPATFEQNYVNVVAAHGVEVMLASNGASPTPVTGWTPVGGSGFRAARVEISGGSHQMTSSSPFGIVVYGYSRYTSYMYPGGLDLEAINVPF